MILRNCWLILICSLFIGCSDTDDESESQCDPHDRTLCREGITYWLDSCGNEEEQAGVCDCGCNGDFTGCLVPCDCTPSCDDRECGPNGCGGACSPGCSGDEYCTDLGICSSCMPSCNGRICGDDGCGQTCPPGCPSGGVCNPDGTACGDYWVSHIAIPQERGGIGVVALDGLIYVTGGYDTGSEGTTNRVDIYDPEADSWTTGQPMEHRRDSHGAIVVDGNIYVMGGATFENRLSVEMYDTVTGVWTTKTPMLRDQTSFATAAVGGKIYTFGGPSNCHVDEYDTALDAWSERSDMPMQRHSVAAVAFDNVIYVIGGGGSGLDAGAGEYLDVVRAYDPNTDSWTDRPNMPTARSGPVAAVVDGFIYVIGGRREFDWDNNTFVPAPVVERFDPASNTWTTGYAAEPTGRWRSDIAVIGRTIYVLGGEEMGVNQFSTANEAYLPPLP